MLTAIARKTGGAGERPVVTEEIGLVVVVGTLARTRRYCCYRRGTWMCPLLGCARGAGAKSTARTDGGRGRGDHLRSRESRRRRCVGLLWRRCRDKTMAGGGGGGSRSMPTAASTGS